MPAFDVPNIPQKVNILSPTINNIMPITGNTAGGAVAEPEKGGIEKSRRPGVGLGRAQHMQSYPSNGETEYQSEKDTHNLLLEDDNPRIEEIPSDRGASMELTKGDVPATSSSLNADYIVSTISTVPVTAQRPPYQPSPTSPLKDAGTPRANTAPSVQSPNGTTANAYSTQHAHQTVLQQHCAFFDPSSSGVIWPHNTFAGFYRLGFGIFLSLLAVFIIHANFSYPTLDSWIPDPFFRIYLKNIHMDKHGSDTNTYDHEGRYVPQHFEEIFEKHAEGREWLTVWDVARMLRGQRCVMDPIGWGGALFEWLATYILLWPEDGRMMKEDIRRIYDGSIFYEIAERRANKGKVRGNRELETKKKI